MPIHVASKRRKLENIRKDFGEDAVIIDVTSKADEPWVRFSPFYPHGGIPVPFSDGVTSESVEGVWQGLKVFEKEDVDVSKFRVTNMKGIKRTERKFGAVKGHRAGVNGDKLLPYVEARKQLYLPAYEWVLENKLADKVEQLRELTGSRTVVLLEYQIALDSILGSHPRLQGCVASCAHCGIRFLTHPRCAGRRDLRCPFGCREHHRRQRSNQRSAAYYRTPLGKQLKEQLNARRGRPRPSSSAF